MRKTLFYLTGIFLASSCVFFAHAEVLPSPAPAKMINQGGQVVVDSRETDAIFKYEEDLLRKAIAQEVKQKRKQHAKNTQQTYREAVNLYRQQRFSLAREILGTVQDSMADYKATESYLKDMDTKSLEKLKEKVHRSRILQDPQPLIDLVQKSSELYEKAEGLQDNRNTAIVPEKINKLKAVLEHLNEERMAIPPKKIRELYIQELSDEIHDEAEKYDLEIYRLTQAKDYAGAQKKFDEFQETMIDKLAELKETIARSKRVIDIPGIPQGKPFEQAVFLYKNKRYREAKGIFDALALQGDGRARAYSIKLDMLILRQEAEK